MTIARKDRGPCEFCDLPILKGDDWTQGADLEDGWMETKHGMRVRPGQPYQSFHSVCYNFVVGDAEGYSDPKDELYDALFNIFGYSENAKHWKEIIDRPILEVLSENALKIFLDWKSFVKRRMAALEIQA